MPTLARVSIALVLFACAFVVNAAGPGTLLVLNKSDDTVSLVDLASKKSVATIPTGSGPHEVAVSPDGRTAVVCNYGSQLSPGRTLTVIDIAGRRATRTIELPQYARPHGVAWFRGDEVAVTTEGTRKLLIVDAAAGKVTATIDIDQNGSHMVAIARSSPTLARGRSP